MAQTTPVRGAKPVIVPDAGARLKRNEAPKIETAACTPAHHITIPWARRLRTSRSKQIDFYYRRILPRERPVSGKEEDARNKESSLVAATHIADLRRSR